jgi:hypothetical protein
MANKKFAQEIKERSPENTMGSRIDGSRRIMLS